MGAINRPENLGGHVASHVCEEQIRKKIAEAERPQKAKQSNTFLTTPPPLMLPCITSNTRCRFRKSQHVTAFVLAANCFAACVRSSCLRTMPSKISLLKSSNACALDMLPSNCARFSGGKFMDT